MTRCEFVGLLLTAEGISAALGVILSFLLEWWPAFEALESRKKRVFVILICVGIPMLVTVAGYFAGCVEALDSEAIWRAVYLGGIVFGASQFAHARQLGN